MNVNPGGTTILTIIAFMELCKDNVRGSLCRIACKAMFQNIVWGFPKKNGKWFLGKLYIKIPADTLCASRLCLFVNVVFTCYLLQTPTTRWSVHIFCSGCLTELATKKYTYQMNFGDPNPKQTSHKENRTTNCCQTFPCMLQSRSLWVKLL